MFCDTRCHGWSDPNPIKAFFAKLRLLQFPEVRCLYPVVVAFLIRLSATSLFLVLRRPDSKLRSFREGWHGENYVSLWHCPQEGRRQEQICNENDFRADFINLCLPLPASENYVSEDQNELNHVHQARRKWWIVNTIKLRRDIFWSWKLSTVELGSRTLGWSVVGNHYDLTRPSQGRGFLKPQIVLLRILKLILEKWKSYFKSRCFCGKAANSCW